MGGKGESHGGTGDGNGDKDDAEIMEIKRQKLNPAEEDEEIKGTPPSSYLNLAWLESKTKELNLSMDDNEDDIDYGQWKSEIISSDDDAGSDDDSGSDTSSSCGCHWDINDPVIDDVPLPDIGFKYWVELQGLCTPLLHVQLKGDLQVFDFTDNKPLPQELYDFQASAADSYFSKEVHDRRIRATLLGKVASDYESLTPDIQASLAQIVFDHVKKGVEYEFVRSIAIHGLCVPTIGIHMTFIARRQDDMSGGWLFSVHLDTAFNPPEVRAYRIICAIDDESLYEGEPLCNGLPVPLTRKDVACRVCALSYKWYKNFSSS